ncbi:hypothetical protein FACS189454_07430 [Planctomycetales bacterium]|nr:hypothetical protein FACS189454_07430 [Planctomycetales bacterium]
MINLDYNIGLNQLMSEVKTVVTTETFLQGSRVPPNISYDIGSEIVCCRLCTIEEMFDSLSTKRDRTPYTLLDDFVVEKVERAYDGFTCYFHKDIKNQINEFVNNLVRITNTCPQVESFVNHISQNKLFHESQIKLYFHVITTISRHVAVIIEARALTLCKRFIQTELLFEAYKAGLYPFG